MTGPAKHAADDTTTMRTPRAFRNMCDFNGRARGLTMLEYVEQVVMPLVEPEYHERLKKTLKSSKPSRSK